jgi:uncharacterized protein (DUF1697 family)
LALAVFLRGVNVGGHKSFRPSLLARALSAYDVVNVGAAGTFVVRRPGSQAKFRAALFRRMPFEAFVVIREGRDVVRFVHDNPFGTKPARPDVVRFVSMLPKVGGATPPMPITIPRSGQWFVRIIGTTNRFVFGEYRRHMKTIGYLGQIDKLFGGKATTRNWNTIAAVARVLDESGTTAR